MSRSIGLDETLTAYVRNANRAEHPALEACRTFTDNMGQISRMQISPEQGAFLQLCARLVNARTVVEIGVFTGYSSTAMLLTMQELHGEKARLYACDINADYFRQARRFWDQAGVTDLVEMRQGDATETARQLAGDITGQADMMFIDADKANYDAYYEAGLEILRPGGLFLFDNVLWSGDVADPRKREGDRDTAALYQLAEKIREDERVDMAFTAIGDGILMAIKR
ncbi:O-methyltransferase [Maricaulis sp.]|uniref:O-methyltransferase n=1 Tax=Maricaulis sp. TaxID=1486257 RepID=UPI00260A5A1E|nr:O-methyltransferase [Maricaulis sp.]